MTSPKKLYTLLLSLMVGSVIALAMACTTQRKEQPIRRTPPLQLHLPSSTSKVKTATSAGDNFFVRLQSETDWTLHLSPETAKEWITLERTRGQASASPVDIAVQLSKNLGQAREAKLIVRSGSLADTIIITQQGTAATPPTPNPDPKPNPPTTDPKGEHIFGDVTLLEAPALAGGSNNYYVTHRANNIVTFSLEYDVDKRHPRFVCFTFDDITAGIAVKRTDAWAWDPIIPQKYSTESMFKNSGYDRGHLVASHDRVYSREANMQTFYYSNMSPQLPSFNQKYWAKLEKQVQDWGRNKSFRDILYVAKGGTIRDDQVENTKVKGRIVVPKYYWMAMVVKKGATYHGLAFWLEHKEWDMKTPMMTVAISIDELEKKLGFDLFHNFPDEIENKFEAEDPSDPSVRAHWPGI
jgi:DNA/RNA non-specific endonuclease